LYELFDHLVGARKQSWWHGQVLHLGGLKIDVQRELGRLGVAGLNAVGS